MVANEYMDIAILVPCQDKWAPEFGQSLVELVKDRAYKYTLCQYNSSLLIDSRTQLVRQALDGFASHFLFVDADMAFPRLADADLVEAKKDIVGASYCNRRPPLRSTCHKSPGVRMGSSKDKTGLEEVEAIGLGLALIRREVFEKIPEPWFATAWVKDETGKIVGSMSEDVFFCRKAKEHGYKIYVDHDVSQQVGHIGSMMFTHDMIE